MSIPLPELELLTLHTLDYPASLALQEQLRDRLLGGVGPATLLLVQHPPTITLGSLADENDLLLPPDELRARGIAVIRTNRGGRVTYHGPGQLVGYPILDLQQLAARGFPRWSAVGSGSPGELRATRSDAGDLTTGPSVRTYLRGLEECLIRLLDSLGLKGRRVEGAPGVWIEDRKIASVGAAVRRWITTHGFALNVEMDLSPFELIRPCGFEGRVMTSVAGEGGRLPPWPELEGLAAAAFGSVFGFEARDHQTSSHQALTIKHR